MAMHATPQLGEKTVSEKMNTLPDAAANLDPIPAPIPDPIPDPIFLHEADGEISLHFDAPTAATTIQSRMRKTAPEQLVLDYTQSMMGFLLFQPQPKRIAMIGLGGGSLAKYCRQKLPKADFTALELNPDVINLREQFGIPPDGPHFRVICADGADYVRDNESALDVLLVDGFNRDGQPAQLCSTAFYRNCYAQLNEGGVLVVNLCADDTGYGSYVGRIRQAFAERIVVVEAADGDNKIVFAGKGSANSTFPPSFDKLAERLRTLEATHPIALAETVQKILRQGQTHRPGRQKRR